MIKKIANKIFEKIENIYLGLSYNIEELEKKQNEIYSDIGFDRSSALKKINSIYKKNPETQDLSSEHHLLFASLSNFVNIKSILEIGTYNASCTKLLSILFPNSSITSMDLRDDDPIFLGTYDRSDKDVLEKFIKKRNEILESCINVDFVQKNSATLVKQRNKNFDLIWVDGAHGYPMISIDIINSLACLARDGFMFIDDVWTKRSKSDSNYRSIGAYETLCALQDAELVDMNLIPKRIDFPHGKGSKKKYIALIKKLEDKNESI
tara:strand:- start:454 stop:1248 length:795 start_codon:yes stop_codon:yes gene_type:complete